MGKYQHEQNLRKYKIRVLGYQKEKNQDSC